MMVMRMKALKMQIKNFLTSECFFSILHLGGSVDNIYSQPFPLSMNAKNDCKSIDVVEEKYIGAFS